MELKMIVYNMEWMVRLFDMDGNLKLTDSFPVSSVLEV